MRHKGFGVEVTLQPLCCKAFEVLEDGTYSAIIVEADNFEGGDPGAVRVEAAVTTGPHKGDMVALVGRFPGTAALALLAEPVTITVRNGQPGVTLDRVGYPSPEPHSRRTASMSQPNQPTDGERAAEGRPQQVPVNMYETTDAMVLVAPLPGVMADDVEVSVDGGRVTLKAAMRSAAPKDYVLHEWHYGPYERTVELPAGFGGKAEATFNNGQLALRIERGEGAGRQTATVTSHEG